MNKKLILYFSYTGNTKYIAKLIQRNIEADICEIKVEKPYSEDYNLVVEQAKQEVNSQFLPTIKPLNIDFHKYTTIFLGTPVWWYTFAPAINTAFQQIDLTNKTIIPFITNGGWIGHTVKDIEKRCLHSIVRNPITIRFDKDILVTPINEIKNWIEKIKREEV